MKCERRLQCLFCKIREEFVSGSWIRFDRCQNMRCVEENDLEINLMQIPFAQMCFVPSDFHVPVKVTDNLYDIQDVDCKSLYFTIWQVLHTADP